MTVGEMDAPSGQELSCTVLPRCCRTVVNSDGCRRRRV